MHPKYCNTIFSLNLTFCSLNIFTAVKGNFLCIFNPKLEKKRKNRVKRAKNSTFPPIFAVNRKFHYVFSTNEFLPFICSPLKQFTTIYPLIFCHTFFPLMPFMHFSLRFSIYARYTKGVHAFFSTFFRWRVLHCSQFCIYPRFFTVCYIHWNHSRILPFVFIGMFFTLSHSCLF